MVVTLSVQIGPYNNYHMVSSPLQVHSCMFINVSQMESTLNLILSFNLSEQYF